MFSNKVNRMQQYEMSNALARQVNRLAPPVNNPHENLKLSSFWATIFVSAM